MHALGDMVKLLSRSPVYLSVLQKRFELPVLASVDIVRSVHFVRVTRIRRRRAVAVARLVRSVRHAFVPARLRRVAFALPNMSVDKV